MRELKFRAWDEEKKRMLYSTESYDYGNTEFRFIDGELCVVRYRCGWNNHAIPNKLESVKNIMQYTGLKDRNGREIYEGNIYLFDGSTGDPGVRAYGLPSKRLTGELFIVAKLDCGFVLRHISSYGHSGFDTPNCIIKGWPIIDNYTLWNHQRSLVYKGNIYENPELLEVENG